MGLLFSAGEKVLSGFESRLFPIKNLYKIPTLEPTTQPATAPEVGTEPTTELEVATEPKAKAKTKSK